MKHAPVAILYLIVLIPPTGMANAKSIFKAEAVKNQNSREFYNFTGPLCSSRFCRLTTTESKQIQASFRAQYIQNNNIPVDLPTSIPNDIIYAAAPTPIISAGTETSAILQAVTAKFLERLAVVVATGNPAAIEAFAAELSTSKFYRDLAFSWGTGKLTDIGYRNYLRHYGKSRMLDSMLKTSLLIATGKALPMIIGGQFEGKEVLAINAASLGLSTAATRSAIRSIEWVRDLQQSTTSGNLLRAGKNVPRLRRLGGVIYTIAEQTIILIFEEQIKDQLTAHYDLKKEKEILAEGVIHLIEAFSHSDASGQTLLAAVETYHAAWTDYREALLHPIRREDDRFIDQLSWVARQAKILSDTENAMRERVNQRKSLKSNIEGRFGSIDAYVESMTSDDRNHIDTKVSTITSSYDKARQKILNSVYKGNMRETQLLFELANPAKLMESSLSSVRHESSLGNRPRAKLFETVKSRISKNRIQSYDDELELLTSVESSMKSSDRHRHVHLIAQLKVIVSTIKAADAKLYRGHVQSD